MFNRLHRRSGRCRNNNNDKEMAGSENEELRIMNMFAEQTLSKSISQLRQEFERLMTLEPRNNVYTSCHQNPRRNRNPNILCPDATRVKLTINVPPDTDYINANWIRFDGIDREFIATQGPMEDTAGDFWRMVFQLGEQNPPTIIMLCQCVEDGQPKCFQYWAPSAGASKTFGNVMATTKKAESIDHFMRYVIEVLPDGCSNSVVIKLYQCLVWPDGQLPTSPMAIVRLLRHIRNSAMNTSPFIVHCSDGLGRTGTLIAIEAAFQRFARLQQPNIMEIVRRMRDQRPGAVRTAGQYVFIHAALLYYIHAKTGQHVDGIIRFQTDFLSSDLFPVI